MNSIFDKCILLLAGALICFLFGVLCYRPKPESKIVSSAIFSSRDIYVEFPDIYVEPTTPEEPEVFSELRKLNRTIAAFPITVTRTRLILKDGHTVFLTAYCAEECGWSYATSSGATCHRSSDDDRYEPTTCAVDLRYFGYDTMFYVPSEDRVYIAEDTGAFRGMWIDTYQDSMSDVYGYNTRYETIYTCEFEDYEETFRCPSTREFMMNYLYQELGMQVNK